MTTIHYAFGPMESMAGQLDSLNARSVSVAEALSAEMTAMANFWDGTSHAADMTYANNADNPAAGRQRRNCTIQRFSPRIR